mgnify:CR=1 FL=1
MPPLIHLKYNNIIELSWVISPSLVTDNFGFNRIKYEYSLCRWQIDYEMKSKSVHCVMRELSWQNSCIQVPQSEWASHTKTIFHHWKVESSKTPSALWASSTRLKFESNFCHLHFSHMPRRLRYYNWWCWEQYNQNLSCGQKRLELEL